jgi:hypothetical protein
LVWAKNCHTISSNASPYLLVGICFHNPQKCARCPCYVFALSILRTRYLAYKKRYRLMWRLRKLQNETCT